MKSLVCNILLMAFICAAAPAAAQDYWFKTYDHGPIEDIIQNIYLIEDTLYVMGGTGFEDLTLRFGTSQWVIDTNGTSIRRSTYPAMDHRKYTVVYEDEMDAFVITGVDSNDRDHISVIHRDGRLLVHNDSIDIVPENSVIEIPHSLVRYKDQYVTAGVFRQEEPVDFHGFITYFNDDFSMDTAIVFRDSFQYAGRLVVKGADLISALSAQRGNPSDHFIYLVKVDSQKTVHFEDMRFAQIIHVASNYFRHMYHKEENHLYAHNLGIGTSTGDRAIVRRINEDLSSEIVKREDEWLYDLRTLSSQDLIELSDGNLLLVGLSRFSDTLSSDQNSCPIAVKLTPDGDILWQRMYLYLRPADSTKIQGGFISAVERDNGDLYFLGAHLDDSDITVPIVPKPFLMKTDRHGCLEPDCLGYNILSSVDRIPTSISEDIKLYPNPTSGPIRVSYDFDQYVIYGPSGQMMSSGKDYRSGQQIVLNGLSPAVYLFVGYDDLGRIWTERFVVVAR